MRYLLLLLFNCIFFCAYAQDPIAQKMNWYGKAKPNSNLFVHFDKNVYSNNETIWFTGYLLKNKPSVSKLQSLIVAIVKDADSSLVTEDRYLLKNGFAYGNLIIPDSIMTGDYHIVAFTNLVYNGAPIDIFSQPITIKTKIEPLFNAEMKLLDSGLLANKVLISANRKDGKPLTKPFKINYKYGNTYKEAQTNLSGNFMITLPHQNQLDDPNLYVKLNFEGGRKFERDSSIISLSLPQPKGKAIVKFYPEGGNSVSGLLNTIGFEVRDLQNQPVQTQAFLYKNGKVIDTISTGSHGMGKFQLSAETGENYSVKLLYSGFLDSIYHLPKVLSNGLNLSIAKAVVEDTLSGILKSTSPKKLFVRVHNFRNSFLYEPLVLDQIATKVKIPLTNMPKGILALTITDSLGRPLAERLFFAHYDKNKKLDISTDKKIYSQREKVELKLKLDSSYKMAAVSIAAVQGNRIALKKKTDIENFVYLNQELSAIPIHSQGNGLADKDYLEYILLIKGWRKYNWEELENINASDTVKLTSLEVKGIVKRGNHIPKKQIALNTFGNKIPEVITTSKSGTFELGTETLLTPAGKNMYVSINDQTKLDFLITVKDPILPFIHSTIKNIPKIDSAMPSAVPNSTELVVSKKEKSISLREVVIRSSTDETFNYEAWRGKRKKNECGDYVCSYGILNCPNHVDDNENVEPTPGESYQIVPGDLKKLIYSGCKFFKKNEIKYFVPVTGIHLEKEFYENDYKDPLEPAFFSTIYWKYSTLLEGNKTTTLNFYTSDITGTFKIVVQGLIDNDVVYAEENFEVKAKQ